MASGQKKRRIEEETREFQHEWTALFAFVRNTDGLPNCLICQKTIARNNKSNLKRHFNTKHAQFARDYPNGDARQKAVEELENNRNQPRAVPKNSKKPSNHVNLASFAVSLEIAKRGRPFTDGEYIKDCFLRASEELFSDFKNKPEIMKKIKNLPLSAKTVQDRTAKMSSNVINMQVEDIQRASGFSLALNESNDGINTTQVGLFVRFVTSDGPKEELLGLLPFLGQPREIDIANAVQTCLEENKIDFNKIVSIATDGSTTRILQGKINHDILTVHCLIPHEPFYAQTFPAEIVDVMNVVIKIINSLAGKAVNQFKELLEEVEKEYSEFVHNKVRWVSRGGVLKRFALCLTDIKKYLNEKGIHHPELTEDMWLQKFHFMLDFTIKFNELNERLQTRGNPAYALLEELVSFDSKLSVFVEDIERYELMHFPNLKKYRDENKSAIYTEYFGTVVRNMKNLFGERFGQFKQHKNTLAFVVNPLTTDVKHLNLKPFGVDAASFQMQLLDLKCKDLWSSKFVELKRTLEELEVQKCVVLKEMPRVDELIFAAWNCLPECFSEVKKLAFGVLTVFGSTYACDQAFSCMNSIKSKLRSRQTNENLESCLKLKITTYEPDLMKLSKGMQSQCSH